MGLPAVFHHNLVTSTIVVSPAADASFPASNLYDRRLYDLFKTGSANVTVTITYDAGVGNTAKADYVFCGGHNLSDPDGSGAVRFKFQSSTDMAAWTDRVDINTVASNRGILRTFTQLDVRGYRIELTRGTTFIPSIGEVMFGERTEFPYANQWAGFDPEQFQLNGQLNRSQTGNLLEGLRVFVSRDGEMTIPLVEDTFIRGTANHQLEDFLTHAEQMRPFAILWNPDNSGTYEEDLIWAVLAGGNSVRAPLKTPLVSGFRDVTINYQGQRV